MTTFNWIMLILGIVGVLGGFAAWVISTFQTKDSARLQEEAITQIVGAGVAQIKAESQVWRSLVEPMREDIRDLKKKFDDHISAHVGGR